ncbi:hypothetical protein GCM10009780_75860 [Actinomadura alba]
MTPRLTRDSLRVPDGFNAAVALGLRTHVDDVAGDTCEVEIVVDRRPALWRLGKSGAQKQQPVLS